MDQFSFSWEGAAHPDGPWQHLRVVGAEIRESLSVEAMIRARATLRIRTRTKPAFRLASRVVDVSRIDAKDGARITPRARARWCSTTSTRAAHSPQGARSAP